MEFPVHFTAIMKGQMKERKKRRKKEKSDELNVVNTFL